MGAVSHHRAFAPKSGWERRGARATGPDTVFSFCVSARSPALRVSALKGRLHAGILNPGGVLSATRALISGPLGKRPLARTPPTRRADRPETGPGPCFAGEPAWQRRRGLRSVPRHCGSSAPQPHPARSQPRRRIGLWYLSALSRGGDGRKSALDPKGCGLNRGIIFRRQRFQRLGRRK